MKDCLGNFSRKQDSRTRRLVYNVKRQEHFKEISELILGILPQLVQPRINLLLRGVPDGRVDCAAINVLALWAEDKQKSVHTPQTIMLRVTMVEWGV